MAGGLVLAALHAPVCVCERVLRGLGLRVAGILRGLIRV